MTRIGKVMSNIKISGVTATQLLDQAQSALEKFTSAKITKRAKVRQFVTDFLGLKNEHMIDSALEQDKAPKGERVLDLTEHDGFTVHKSAIFVYTQGNIKLVAVDVVISIKEISELCTIKIYQGIIDFKSGYMQDASPAFNSPNPINPNERTMENYRAAINYSFDLCTWINRVKEVVEIQDLESDGWHIDVFGQGIKTNFDPLELIDSLKRVDQNYIQSNKNEVEHSLLKLAGFKIENGYYHCDIVKSVNNLSPIFGTKFDSLLKK